MCNFFSAIGLRDGSIRWHPMLDSHSDLLVYFGLEDESEYQARFVKLELMPNDNWLDPETWVFTIDETVAPVWCDEALQAAFHREMINIARRFILIDGEKRLIVDGCWIIGQTAHVRDIRGGRVLRVQGSASIRNVWGSASIRNVGGSASIQNVGENTNLDQSALDHVIKEQHNENLCAQSD